MTEVNADKIAEIIRAVDGNHTLGAGALADKIAEYVESTRQRSDLEIVQKALTKQGLDLSMNGGHWAVYYPFVVEGVVIEGDDAGKLLAWAKQQLGE